MVIRPYDLSVVGIVWSVLNGKWRLPQPCLGNAAHSGLEKSKEIRGKESETPRVNSKGQIALVSIRLRHIVTRAQHDSNLCVGKGERRRRSNSLRALRSAGLGEVSAEGGEQVSISFPIRRGRIARNGWD